MTDSTQRARHRAPRRPITPLDDFASVATGSVAAVGKRAGVAAASSGLIAAMLGAAPAAANPAGETSSLKSVDTAAIAASARSALSTGPTVSVDANTEWGFSVPEIEVVPEPVAAPTPAARPAAAAPAPAARATAPREPASGANVPAAVAGNAVLEVAARYVGTPYVSGGAGPGGFDCSGFTQYVFRQLGISLPRTTNGQKAAGTIVSRADAQPGDIIWSPGHVGIYVGGNQQIDSPRPGKTIQFRGIWQSNPVFVRVTG